MSVVLTVSASNEDYSHFGYKLKTRSKSSKCAVIADTGCQSCHAGIKVIHRPNLKRSDLIPVTMKMHAANNKHINILGAVILHFTGKDPNGGNL